MGTTTTPGHFYLKRIDPPLWDPHHIKMKKRARWFLYITLFVLGIYLGWKLGTLIQRPIEIDPPLGSQRNLLVIGVDRNGTTKARLQGIWYVAYRLDKPLVTLMPLYPGAPVSNSERDQQLEQIFRINQRGVPDKEFIATIKSFHEINWDAQIVIDDIAIMEIVNFLGGLERDGKIQSGPLVVGEIPPAWENRSGALDGQTQLLDLLCQKAAARTELNNLQYIIDLIPHHIATELEVSEALEDWSRLITSDSDLKCDFPLRDSQ
jgi:hypothetical protein